MLTITDMSLEFYRYENNFFRKEAVRIISNFNLTVKAGEITAIIGSSGSGKSLLAHTLAGILPSNVSVAGTILFKGEELSEARKAKLRGREIALIPQSVNFLNPLQTTGRQVYRSARLHGRSRREAVIARDRAFQRYNLDDTVKNLYPFQISGGMARRVLTAIATVTDADLIIADEPTAGLDANAIDESLSHLRELADTGKGIILITHDVKYALHYADTIAVFYGGATVEIARPSDFTEIRRLRHPFTRELFASLPGNGFSHSYGLNVFAETLPQGCVFEPCCRIKSDICRSQIPDYKTDNTGRVWCHNA